MPLADHVHKLASGACAYCERTSVFSLRITADERQEVVGGSDMYQPVCRRHYVELSSVRAVSEDATEETKL